MRTFLSIAVLHIAAVCASSAEQPNVTRVSRVFSPYIQPGQWEQVTAELRNPTDRMVQVRFIYNGFPGGKIDYTRTVNLPGMTHRTIRLGQRVGPIEIEKNRSSTKKIQPREQAFSLEDAQTNTILHKDFILVSALAPTQCCLGYVDPEDPPGQDHAYLGNIPDSPFGDVALVSSRQQRLPDRWYGYSMLEILVLSSTEPAELSDGQIDAILDWVGRGGVLLVTAHSVADRTLTGPISEAAGVVVSETHQEYRLEATSEFHQGPPMAEREASSLPATATADGSGRFQVDMKTPMVMAHLCPTDADVLWEGNGMPLLTLRRHGAGAIFTLALPIGALATDQSGPLWQTIARQMERVQPVSPESFATMDEDKSTQFANRLAGRKSRDRRTPTCIIGAQAALFLLLGLFLRLRRRGELVWVAMIPLGLLGGVGMLIWGMTFRDSPRVSFLSLASVRPDGRTHVQQLSTYYTPETENIDFSSGSPLGTIRPMASGTSSVMETVKIAGKQTMVLEGGTVIANSSRSAYAEAPVNLPGRLAAEVQLGPKGLEGTITNNTGQDLFDAIVVTGGEAYTVGLLPAGRTTDIVVNDPPLPKDTYTGKTVRDDKDLLRNDLIAALVSPPSASRSAHGGSDPTPMLLGWSRSAGGGLLDPLGKVEQAESNGLTLLTSSLPLLKSPSGTKVVVPGGLLKLDIGGRPPVWDVKKHQFNESTLPGEVELSFAPPSGAGEITDARAVMGITMRAPNCRMSVFGFVGREGQVPVKTLIETVDRPVGTYKITVDSLVPVAGRYKITIKIGPVESPKPGATERISTLWKIESLNLTLEGMSK